MRKTNCWELKHCGREPDGFKSALGVCPAASEGYLNSIHGGVCAGRACWVITGTFCDDEQQGSFANKFEKCEQCDFYRMVRREEGKTFMVSVVLLHIAKGASEKARHPRKGSPIGFGTRREAGHH